MKNSYLILALLLIFSKANSQENIFNISNYKVFRIEIQNASNENESDFISRTVEKNGLSIFSYIDKTTNTGIFIVNKNADVINILNLLSDYRFDASRTYEATLTEENFLDMYMKRGGIKSGELDKVLPKFIQMGPDNELSGSLYSLAKSIWVKKYPEAYNSMFPQGEELKKKQEETKRIKGY